MRVRFCRTVDALARQSICRHVLSNVRSNDERARLRKRSRGFHSMDDTKPKDVNVDIDGLSCV